MGGSEAVCQLFRGLFFPGSEVALEDVLSCLGDEVEVEGKVVDGCYLHGEEFSGVEQVV